MPTTSGFNVSISDAESYDVAAQVADVLKFIRRNQATLRKLRSLRLHWIIDFGIESSAEHPYLPVRIPSQLISAAAKFGGEVEVSCYFVSQ